MASVVSVMSFQPSFKVLSGYFYVSLNLTGILYFPNLAEFRDTAALTYAEFEFSTFDSNSFRLFTSV